MSKPITADRTTFSNSFAEQRFGAGTYMGATMMYVILDCAVAQTTAGNSGKFQTKLYIAILAEPGASIAFIKAVNKLEVRSVN